MSSEAGPGTVCSYTEQQRVKYSWHVGKLAGKQRTYKININYIGRKPFVFATYLLSVCSCFVHETTLTEAGIEHFLRTGSAASVSLFALGVLQSVVSVWKEVDLLTCKRIKHLSAPNRLVFRWRIHPWGETVHSYKLGRNKSPGLLNILMWVFNSVCFLFSEIPDICRFIYPSYSTGHRGGRFIQEEWIARTKNSQ